MGWVHVFTWLLSYKHDGMNKSSQEKTNIDEKIM
jgi:hypothetical protein